jgi:maltose 6'-phosphate phosphatase
MQLTKKVLFRFVLLASFVVVLSGCKCCLPSAQRQTIKTINFYSKSSAVTLCYKGIDKAEYEKAPMKRNQNNWWHAEIKSTQSINFKFVDGKGTVYNLGGTMGNYPNDPSEDYSTSVDEIWVKNGLMFNYCPDNKRPLNDLVVLTLNMHTYQEKEQGLKLDRIVNAINELNPDVVVLQECAQHKDSEIIGSHYGKIIKTDNMALIVTNKLKNEFNKKYHYYWDWSHYGWDVWEEGMAVLSKYKITETESKYITKNHDKKFWKSRNVTMIQTDIPKIGKVNIYSAHLGWWNDKEEPFKGMFEKLNNWILEEDKNVAASFVCGDFNVVAGSEGYKYLMNTDKYIDAYYEANPNGFGDSTIGGKIDGWEKGDAVGKRIDYMFLVKGGSLKPFLAQRIFTEKSFGRVSDHCGVYFYLKK